MKTIKQTQPKQRKKQKGEKKITRKSPEKNIVLAMIVESLVIKLSVMFH